MNSFDVSHHQMLIAQGQRELAQAFAELFVRARGWVARKLGRDVPDAPADAIHS
jgi:hypothetical protein